MTVKFSFEVPLKHLNDFNEDQDFIFALSLLCKHDEYTQYLRRSRAYKSIWMDNSFNETFQACTTNELAWLYKMFRPSRIISPDSPKWSVTQIADAYRDLRGLTVPEDDIIIVVSSWDMYKQLAAVGRNFAASYHVRGESFTRQDLYDIPGLHLLGLLTPDEVREVQPASLDTSMPVKLACLNKSMYDWYANGCEHIHTKDLGFQGRDFFRMEMTTKQVDLAKANISWLKHYCNEGSN